MNSNKDIKEDNKTLNLILRKADLFIKYSTGILIGFSVIGLGRILLHSSIQSETVQKISKLE